ncbi:MAG: hypothetical protein K8L91_30725 [Anaerolineae bacterium]|nr:hypothetical protein [Anaerolineae bacterium]
MSRVINTDGPAKIRNQHMRTCAEILRHLSKKKEFDAETKDMIAQIVFSLREVNDTIEQSSEAWEKRNYWMKAEEFRQRWTWTGKMADQVEDLVRRNNWEAFPSLMVSLFQHFGEIKVNKFTRDADTWQGAYDRLMNER